jgi:hypothetical protein
MACPSDENNGFIQITDSITQSNLNDITINTYPLTISFAPRTTLPTLSGNQIVESNATENTCIYKGNRYQLVSIQLCSVLHKGYLLPSQNIGPEAELILTFSSSSPNISYSGILLSIPIYQSNNPVNNEYIDQLIKESVPSCKYNNVNGQYEGKGYQNYSDSSLNTCIQYCCNDPNCKSYNFQMEKKDCSLYNNIPALTKKGDKSLIAGTVEHNILNPVGSCSVSSKDNTTKIATLESIFTTPNVGEEQTSFSYKTCFEVIDSEKTISSKNIVIFIFPKGIQISGSTIELLKLKLNYTFPTYKIPSELRDDKSTLSSYRFNSSGNKSFDKADQSKIGNIYTSKLSSCSSEFKNRFEYFTSSPRLPTYSSRSVSDNGNVDGSCSTNNSSSYYKTTQYKCVPFNQLTDLSGEYVIPGNKTLDTVLQEQKQVELKQKKGDVSKKSITTDEIETYVAGAVGLTLAVIIAVGVGSWISNRS